MKYAEIFASEYLAKIFYYCLKKTGNEQDAHELASDIGFEVLRSISKGNRPENFNAWVWRVAANRYAKWAKTRYYSSNSLNEDIENMKDTVSSEENLEREIILRDDINLVNRELAFIRSDYRKILTAYYFENKSVTKISDELGIPLGTVMTRLQNGRKLLKEGMNMARTFGKRSYIPEEIRFINSGAIAGNGQPWSILSRLLYKNIFLEVYNDPKSAKELSLELGVSLAYMEDDLRYLTKQTFLECVKDRYETTFSIIGRDAQKEAYEAAIAIAGHLTKLLEQRTDYINDIAIKNGNSYYGQYQTYGEAKWTLLMYAFKNMFDKVCKYKNGVRVPRPDGGGWEIVGFQTADLSFPAPVEFNISREIRGGLFGMFRFKYDWIPYKIPYWLSESEIRALILSAKGQFGDANEEDICALLKYGYLSEESGSIRPRILIFDKKEKLDFSFEEQKNLFDIDHAIKNIMSESHKKTIDIMRREMPKKFFDNANQYNCVLRSLAINRDYICECAIKDGYLRYDMNTSPVLGNFVFI